MATYDRYNATLNKLKAYLNKKFHGKKSLSFNEVTVRFLKDYERYLREESGNMTNTIGKELKSIRRIINEAINDQIFSYEKNPFHRFKITWESTTKVYLEEHELKAIESYKVEPGTVHDLHKDMFVFSCYAGGLRISDLCLMKWIYFNGTHINMKTRKTSSVVSIKLSKVCLLYTSPSPRDGLLSRMPSSA